MTSAALILFLALVAMASGPGTEVKMLATAPATGILINATVIRALIAPAVILLMGRWNWWLPRLPARLLRLEPSPPPRTAPSEAGWPAGPARPTRAEPWTSESHAPALLSWTASRRGSGAAGGHDSPAAARESFNRWAPAAFQQAQAALVVALIRHVITATRTP